MSSRLPLPVPPRLDLSACALFLDLDGTLARIEPRPEGVGPEPRRTRILRGLETALGGRLAVVSGRSLESIDAILEQAVACAAGVHGLERRTAAGIERPPPHPELPAVHKALDAFAAAWPGVQVEVKGLSLALHYRQAPEAEAAVRSEVERLAASAGLTLQHGRMVAELRTPGPDKGAAVAAFMAEPPFSGAEVPVFVGDDLTDEHAFEAVARLGGYGVLVGPSRGTAARYRLDDVDGVLAWLEAALD